jgi:hypothetical protein
MQSTWKAWHCVCAYVCKHVYETHTNTNTQTHKNNGEQQPRGQQVYMMPSQVPPSVPLPSGQPGGMQPGVRMSSNMPGMRMSPSPIFIMTPMQSWTGMQPGVGASTPGPQPGVAQQPKQTSGGALNKLRSFLGLVGQHAQQQNSGSRASTDMPGASLMGPWMGTQSGYDIGGLQSMPIPSMPTMPYMAGQDPASLGDFMYVCMYVCIYIYIYIYIHTHIYIHIHTCTHA